jgi:hypothetical protein
MGEVLDRWFLSGRGVLVAMALLAVAIPVASHWTSLAAADAYEVRLSSGQQVPPVRGSTGLGNGGFFVSADRSLEGSIATSGIDGTAAHLHEGAVGRVGPVIVPLEKRGDVFVVPPHTRLTSGQIASLQAGHVYVSVRSVRYPDGELRAQLARPAMRP